MRLGFFVVSAFLNLCAKVVDVEVLADFGGSSSLSFVTGVVAELHRVRSLERVLWRATRGNMYFRTMPSEHDPEVSCCWFGFDFCFDFLVCLFVADSCVCGAVSRSCNRRQSAQDQQCVWSSFVCLSRQRCCSLCA